MWVCGRWWSWRSHRTRGAALAPPDAPPAHVRRRRYAGKNPRAFHDKYKELNPERYAADVEKVLASGRTPAGMHVPIMEREVLDCLRPRAGEVAVDCTLGWGGHARAILRTRAAGRPRSSESMSIRSSCRATEARLRAAGFGPDVFVARHGNFAGLPAVLAAEGLTRVDVVLADLGVSSMQFDNPDRGFSYKGVGPLDMRMNPLSGEIRGAADRALDGRGARAAARGERRRTARASHRPAAEAAASRDDTRGRTPAARRPQLGASAPDEGRREDVHPQDVSGPAYCGQRRVLRARRAAARAASSASRRAVASRC